MKQQKIIIHNDELFEAMKDEQNGWTAYCEYAQSYGQNQYPIGGVDHIERKRYSIIIHDVGINGKTRDIIVRRES